METIIISPKSKQELVFISEMLKRLNIKSKVLSDDEKEDLALGRAVEQGMKGKNASKASVLKHLRR